MSKPDWHKIRLQFPALENRAYLNTATFGQLPRRATEAVSNHWRHRDELACTDFLTWYDDADRREFDALVDTLVVNETYFFRELHPLRVLTGDVLVPAVLAGRRPRVWCAACSTGEEPLTLAMLLDEGGVSGRVEIVASDISKRALARVRDGSYGGRALRALEAGPRARWFESQGDRLRVRRELQEAISWREINLKDDDAIRSLGLFDAVLCRNVLIYFCEPTVTEVASRLARSLSDNGVLLVCASESLMRFGTMLTCEERSGSFFYVKTR